MKHVMTMALTGALLAVAGCGGAPATKTAAAPTCADAAAHAHAVLADDENGAAMAAGLRDAIAERCPADGWSAEAITCITSSGSHDELHGCHEKLTPEQHQKLDEQMHALHGNGEHEMMKMKKEEPPPAQSAPAPSDPCGGGE